MKYLTTLSRDFRKAPTAAEKHLWQHIRRRQLMGFKFRHQYVFSRYIVDFVCLSVKLIIEVDGEIHLQNIEADRIRTQYLNNLGFRELRFTNDQVINNINLVTRSIVKSLIE